MAPRSKARPRYFQLTAAVGAVFLMSLVLAACFTLPGPARAMSFSKFEATAECGGRLCILATGLIDQNATRDFKRFLDSQPGHGDGIVFLDSPGGFTLEGLSLGSEIRKAGLSTRVETFDPDGHRAPAVCASACAFAFLGGVTRRVGPQGRLGVHQLAALTDPQDLTPADTQYLTSMICLYFDKVGGSLSVLAAALQTPPDQVHWLSQPELLRAGLDGR